MPLPPVVIELSPSDAGSPNAPALAESCTGAVSDGECRLGAVAGETPRAVAIVTWDAEHRRARVEIGVRGAEKSRWSTRELDFREADPEPERWRSVGLVIATLVGEAEAAEATPAPAPAASPPAAAAPKPATPARRDARPEPTQPPAFAQLWLGAEAIAGPALDDGTWRFGGGLVGVLDLPARPLLASGTLRYLIRPADDREVDVRWASASLGLGIHHEPAGRLRLEGRLEALLERTQGTVSGGQSDSGGVWLAGLRVGVAVGYRLDEWAVLTLGGEISGMNKGVVVTLHDDAVGRAHPLTASFTAGLRFGLL